ncbi:chaplin [Streptomyces lasalocidi]
MPWGLGDGLRGRARARRPVAPATTRARRPVAPTTRARRQVPCGNSPGVISGDVIQVPIGIDANVCGDTIDLIGLLNPASGNTCSIK